MISAPVVRAAFARRFGREPRLFAAPGRVNLIGEHTDYNDGFVLPLAIDRETMVAAAPRTDGVISAWSTSAEEAVEIDLASPPRPRRGTYADFLEGMARILDSAGVPISGADLLIESDVPIGAGVSSSAALEIAVGLALTSIAGRLVSPQVLALAGQRAEHEYVGTRCGVMDQLIVALGRRDHALLLDCRSLAHTLVPLDPARALVLVCDTGTKHQLAESGYNDRRAECEQAVTLLARALPNIRALRDVNPEQLAANASLLPPLIERRARHVVDENVRTWRAAQALREGDLVALGKLMYASHQSLRDDFEVSTPELDCLVRAAARCTGVYGARMTGGGFGGCTITLVDPARTESVAAALTRAMVATFGRPPSIFVTRACDGAREIS